MTSPRVVILSGGKGTRLRPFTASFPKPLVPIGDMPILEVVLRQLAQHGLTHATLAVGHLADLIRAFVTQHQDLSRMMQVDFVSEKEPTGTAGSLANIKGLDDTFLVMNGDVLTDLDYQNLIKVHKQSGAALTIAGHREKRKIGLGVLETEPDGRLTNYVEKPEYDFNVSMGIYVYEPRVLDLIQPGKYLDFPDLVLQLLEKGEHVQVHNSDAFWLDIGRPEDYALAQEIFEREPEKFNIGKVAQDLKASSA
ncbi:MAG: nucleotidyltransferase family protein [Hyphomicrobiaceae bacterium]